MLALEGATGSAEGYATAAGRVFDKLHANLDPLLGIAGVQALFTRSAKLLQSEHSFFSDPAILGSATKLRERLQALEPAAAADSAAALFETFLVLITTFVGDRLTTEVLRTAWPTIEDVPTTEKT